MNERGSHDSLTGPSRDSITLESTEGEYIEDFVWEEHEYIAGPQERKNAVEAATEARRRCRELASELHAVLPRELRNMIYTYVVGPSVQFEYAFDTHGSVQIGFLDLGASELAETCQTQTKSWAMDPAYFGTDVAIELAEAYYSYNRFSLTSDEFLDSFLSADPFTLGIRPYEHLRRLDLALDCQYPQDVDFTSMATHLQALQPISCGQRKMEICINLTTSFEKSWKHHHNSNLRYTVQAERTMLNILELLRWPVYEMLHKGHAIQVFHENLDMEDRTSQEIAQRDLTRYRLMGLAEYDEADFFYMTKEEWLEEKGEDTVADPVPYYVLPLPATKNEEPNTGGAEGDLLLEKRLREALKRRWGKDHALEGFSYPYDKKM